MKKAVFIQDQDFERVIREHPLVIVVFIVSWCGLSQEISPLLNQLADDYQEQVKVFKMDIIKNKQIAERFKINFVPNIFYFKNGERVQNLVGLLSYEVMSRQLEKLL
ncbi:MAG: conjugal transfer protein TraF [Limnoraphis sp. WC205]|jgi:thioredoxin 1|nr:conjugal transfer protein TraF [Limnoraphis sp. WC205]